MERLVILLPKELKEALAKAAEADRRSMSTYVMMLIECALQPPNGVGKNF